MEQANRALVRIRRAVPEDASGIARVRVITWKAQYTGIVPAGYLAQLSPEEDTPRWQQALAYPAHARALRRRRGGPRRRPDIQDTGLSGYNPQSEASQSQQS